MAYKSCSIVLFGFESTSNKRLAFIWIVAVLFLQLSVEGSILTTGVHQGRPGLNSPSKLWWTKQLTNDYYVAGRPSSRWVKYAYEGGFKSILSVFAYNESESLGAEYLPTAAEASNLATSLGMDYVSVIDTNADWKTVETIQKFSKAVSSLKRPALLHCTVGYSVTFLMLSHMANQTRYDQRFEPKIYSHKVYATAASMGLNFNQQDLKDIVSLITGEPVVADPPVPNTGIAAWMGFWPARWIEKNWFIAGQIRRGDVDAIEAIGFKTVVNLRLGTVHRGRSSQEQVTLLNIKDIRWTYRSDTCPNDQSTSTLERSRIDANLDPAYVRPHSQMNYERLNREEFGDEIGYNEDFEKVYFSHRNISYLHLPINFYGIYRPALFKRMEKSLMEAGKRGPVLLHCNSGRRAAYIGVLAAAVQEGHNLPWALTRLRQLGYTVSQDTHPDVFMMYKYNLLKPTQKERINKLVEG